MADGASSGEAHRSQNGTYERSAITYIDAAELAGRRYSSISSVAHDGNAIMAARTQDVQERTAALRRADPDPGSIREAEAKSRMEQARLDLPVLAQIERDRLADIVIAVTAYAPELVPKLALSAVKATKTAQVAPDRAEAAINDREDVRHLISWTDSLSRDESPVKWYVENDWTAATQRLRLAHGAGNGDAPELRYLPQAFVSENRRPRIRGAEIALAASTEVSVGEDIQPVEA